MAEVEALMEVERVWAHSGAAEQVVVVMGEVAPGKGVQEERRALEVVLEGLQWAGPVAELEVVVMGEAVKEAAV